MRFAQLAFQLHDVSAPEFRGHAMNFRGQCRRYLATREEVLDSWHEELRPPRRTSFDRSTRITIEALDSHGRRLRGSSSDRRECGLPRVRTPRWVVAAYSNGRRRHGAEIQRDQIPGVVVEKRAPSVRAKCGAQCAWKDLESSEHWPRKKSDQL